MVVSTETVCEALDVLGEEGRHAVKFNVMLTGKAARRFNFCLVVAEAIDVPIVSVLRRVMLHGIDGTFQYFASKLR